MHSYASFCPFKECRSFTDVRNNIKSSALTILLLLTTDFLTHASAA